MPNQKMMKVANGMILDMKRTTLVKNGNEIHLTPNETKLLALLIDTGGRVVSRAELMHTVWRTDYLGDTRTLNVHICYLRQKIENNPSVPELILTRRGLGYELRI